MDSDSDRELDSDSSGHERIGDEGRVLTTSVWYCEEEEEDTVVERRMATEKTRVFRTFRAIGNGKLSEDLTNVTCNIDRDYSSVYYKSI